MRGALVGTTVYPRRPKKHFARVGGLHFQCSAVWPWTHLLSFLGLSFSFDSFTNSFIHSLYYLLSACYLPCINTDLLNTYQGSRSTCSGCICGEGPSSLPRGADMLAEQTGIN